MKLTHIVRNSVGAAILAGALMLAPAAHARVFVSVGVAPPAIPVYEQPPCPGYGYIWTPGYWAYGPQGYYWVDGAWVLPPYEGALWTPGYWGWGDDAYFWNPGYWGLNVGYYGGINYGFGYFGTGFYGGYWRGGRLFYNAEYNRFGFHDHNSFIYHQHVGRFDGRPGGAAFARNDGRGGFGGRDFNRGATVNGRSFATQQAGFRNGTVGARNGFTGGTRENGQQFRGGYSAQQQTRFGQGGNGAAAPQFRYGSSPQSRMSSGGNFGGQSRGAYSAPAAPQARSFGGGNFGGGARTSGGGNFGGGSHGGGGGGGFRGGGGGGGFHGGGGGHR